MNDQPNDKPLSYQPSKKWLTNPLGYVFVGFLAATFSVVLYAGASFLYQKYVASSVHAQGVLDNPASAEVDNDKGLLIKSAKGFRLVAKKVGPAVVNIKSTKKPKVLAKRRFHRPDQRQQPFDQQDPFREFFEHFGLPFGGDGFQQRQMPEVGLGSGIIIDKKGHVVTNNHVIDGATEIVVGLTDQPIDRKAKLIGTDPRTDLAVLKLQDLEGLPEPVEWADSDKVEVGDWAIAIGSPFNIGQSVTVGIISAKGRREPVGPGGDEYLGDLLQTDAAINPGNSGGPLCDIEGHVMGVNRAIFTRSGGYMGIGFAIPSNLAKHVVSTLIKDGKIIRGWLGVYIQRLDSALAKDLGIKHGVGIHQVMENSPAEKAGLQAGDVILEVQGKPIKKVNKLQSIITQHKPGDVVKLKIVSYSSKKKKTIKVKIGTLPSSKPLAQTDKSEGPTEPDELGLVVNSTESGKGVIVEYIAPGIGQQSGLKTGDVIMSINRRKTNSLSKYQKAIKSSKRLYLEVMRDGRKMFFQVFVSG